MQEEWKTKIQLLQELNTSRSRVGGLDQAERHRKKPAPKPNTYFGDFFRKSF